MKKARLLTIATLCLALFASAALAANGEALFQQHCAVCHPDGGNIVKAERTLHTKALKEEGIKDWKGIVKFMRSPDPGMPAFSTTAIPDPEAKEIAEYILKTFK